MKNRFFLAGQMIMILFLCSSCAMYTQHFGVENRAATVPDDFGQTEAAIAQAEQSQGAQYCPEKIAKAKELAKGGRRSLLELPQHRVQQAPGGSQKAGQRGRRLRAASRCRTPGCC